MQYGHCVVSATATAISSLYFSGIAPSLNAASSNAMKPLNPSGASSPSFLNFVRFFMSYMAGSLIEWPFFLPPADCLGDADNSQRTRRNVASARRRQSGLGVHLFVPQEPQGEVPLPQRGCRIEPRVVPAGRHPGLANEAKGGRLTRSHRRR